MPTGLRVGVFGIVAEAKTAGKVAKLGFFRDECNRTMHESSFPVAWPPGWTDRPLSAQSPGAAFVVEVVEPGLELPLQPLHARLRPWGRWREEIYQIRHERSGL